MQIGALELVNSIVSLKNSRQSSNSNEFAGLLSGFVDKESPKLHSNSRVEEKQKLSKEELEGIVQWLNNSDSPNFREELRVKDKSIEGTDVSEMIREQLQLSDEELIAIITSFLNGIQHHHDGANNSFAEDELNNLMDEISDMDAAEALQSFVQFLPLINMDQLTVQHEQELAAIAKSLKLFDSLLSQEQSIMLQQQLKEFLQKLGEKFESLLREKVSQSRSDYLGKAFAPVVKEIRNPASLLINRQGDPVTVKSGLPQNGPVLTAKASEVPMENASSLSMNVNLLSYQSLSRPDQLSLLQGQPERPVTVEQLTQQFAAILSKSQWMNEGGTQKLFIRLYPEHLGSLRIELIQKNSVLTARILTTSSTAKEVLESQLQSLKTAFSSQNIQVNNIEISQQLSQEQRYINRDPEHQQQRQHEEQEEKESTNESSFSVSFEEELLNIEV